MRRVIAFIGGLDLTDGRYDNPEHSLFRTLKVGEVHNGDFYQPSVEGKQSQAGAVF
jgi:phospholipase D1/2